MARARPSSPTDHTPTDERCAVRVLMRGVPLGAGVAQRKIGGYVVFVVGAARQDKWPEIVLQNEDTEGITWTLAHKALEVSEWLRTCAGVVDAKPSAVITASMPPPPSRGE